MKKFSLALCACALLSLLFLPPVLAHRPALAKRADFQAHAPSAATQTRGDVTSEAMTTAPGVAINPASIPTVPVSPILRPDMEEDEEGKEALPESDLDPQTLLRLKQQPYVAPQTMPKSYTVQADGEGQALTAAGVTAADETPAPQAPALLRNFTGPNTDQQQDGFVRRPPDPDMAAGPAHIVTVVNTIIAVYDKNGTQLQIGNLGTRFSGVNCNGCRAFDPRVIYEPNANRFIVMMVSKNDSTQESKTLLAVSQTGDPTGAWWNYALDARLDYNGTEPTWADFPDIGFDGIAPEQGGAIYVTSNQFTFASNSYRTALLAILPKASLYTGASLSYSRAFDRRNSNGSPAFTLRPAKTYGNPGVEYMVNTSGSNSSFVSLWRVVPTYPPAAVDWTLQTTYNIGAYSVPPQAQQPGCGSTHDTGDNRIYNAVWRNNRIYAAFTEAFNRPGGAGTISAIRLLKLNTASNTAEINETYHGADDAFYSYPAIATDSAENIVLVFARTSATEFASIRYTGRLTTDGTTQDSTPLKNGVQCLTGNRYGDYQGAAVDPADGTKVWVFGEYAADAPNVDADFDWGTWVGQVQFGAGPTCTYLLSPAGDTAAAAGKTGSFRVIAQAGCAWTAQSSVPWITITGGGAGSVNGTVSYTVAANTSSTPRAGTITVADQSFTISQPGVACATSASISFGQTVTGTLSASDCRAAFRSGSFADRYTFNGTAGQQVAISMTPASATPFDTYLFLLAPNGAIAASDDDGGPGTDSRIPPNTGSYTLTANGTYTIEATSFDPATSGDYTLTLTGTTAGPSTLQFSAANYSFSESSASAIITVTRTGDASSAATVNYMTVDDQSPIPCDPNARDGGGNPFPRGTAFARCDYATTLDTLTFAPGETSKDFLVPLVNDIHIEGNEVLALRLSNPTGAALGALSAATLTITDNDVAGQTNPIYQSPFFVRLQYLDFLSREPDQSGFDSWMRVLNGCADVNNVDPNAPSAGCDRLTVSASFFGSQEFQLKGFYVFRFYVVAFGRLPAYDEIVPDMRAVTGQTSQEVFAKKAQFANAFTQRTEFTNRYNGQNDSTYVTTLLAPYHVTTITTPDPQQPDGTVKVTLTSTDLINRLSGAQQPAMTRAQVLRAIADSDQVGAQEFNRAFVLMQYVGYLRRTPDQSGFNAWLNYLNGHPTDFRTMVNGFMNSTEYRLRFGQP